MTKSWILFSLPMGHKSWCCQMINVSAYFYTVYTGCLCRNVACIHTVVSHASHCICLLSRFLQSWRRSCSAIDSTYCYIFVRITWSVCLSHSSMHSALKCSTDLDIIQQLYLWGYVVLNVVSGPQMSGKFGDRTSSLSMQVVLRFTRWQHRSGIPPLAKLLSLCF